MGIFKPNVEKLKENRDVDGLIKALKHNNGNIQDRARTALVEIGDPTVVPLGQALKNKDRRVRINAANALGKIRSKKAINYLIIAL